MPTQAISANNTPLQSLFEAPIEDRILLSCHLLGKPTVAQFYRLHAGEFAGIRSVNRLLEPIKKSDDRMLAVIQPIDIEQISRKLPHIYLDTTQSRRRIQKLFGVPYRRTPELPSCDWRFLFHDVTMVDELISFELTARGHGLPFGYESHFDEDGKQVYPKVTISDGQLVHPIQPKPDKTLIVGDYHLVLEHDCGEETVSLGHIMRDATIARKQLVYEQLERDGALDRLGWNKRLYLYVINGKRRTKKSSRTRIKSCIETLPETVDPHRFFFIDRQTFMEAEDDISRLMWMRGDGQVMELPCWSRSRKG